MKLATKIILGLSLIVGMHAHADGNYRNCSQEGREAFNDCKNDGREFAECQQRRESILQSCRQFNENQRQRDAENQRQLQRAQSGQYNNTGNYITIPQSQPMMLPGQH